MTGTMRLSPGLLGRILIVLLLTVLFEFGASTLLYERAGSFSWRDDEARRLAEHLVIAHKLLAERAPIERPAIAEELTTDRYDISWSPGRAPPPMAPLSQGLIETQREILAWEPGLAATNLRLGGPRFERRLTVVGAFQLPDRSWVYFAAHGDLHPWSLTAGRVLIALVPAAALLLLGALLIRRMLQPIQHLSDATERIGTGAPVLLTEEGTPEVRGLIRSFNAMQSRIHRLVEDRVQALAAVGHDIRTPLSRVRLRLDGIAEEDVREEIEGDVLEIEAMIASLLAFIGGDEDPEAPQRIDLAVLASTIAVNASDAGHVAHYEGPERLEATVRPSAIRRAIGNLVENAIHYGGEATLSLSRQPDGVRISVEDQGPGIPEGNRAAVLEPFVRLDEARGRNTKGLGLGLTIVARAVEREGGTLSLENRDTGGLRAEILLPKA